MPRHAKAPRQPSGPSPTEFEDNAQLPGSPVFTEVESARARIPTVATPISGAALRSRPMGTLTPPAGDPWGDLAEGSPWHELCPAFDDGHGVQVTGCALGDLTQLDDVMSRFMRSVYIPNATVAVVAGDGRLVCARGYTYSAALTDYSAAVGTPAGVTVDLSSVEIPLTTPEAQFRVASITKAMTAAAAMQLVEAGLFEDGLDEPLVRHVTISDVRRPRWVEQVKLWHLLSHCSGWQPISGSGGINDILSYDLQIQASTGLALPLDRQQVYDFLSTLSGLSTPSGGFMVAQPGTSFRYYNLNFALVAEMIESATGRPYLNWLRNHILRPLGCTSTTEGSSAILQPDELEYWAHNSGRVTNCLRPIVGARQQVALNARGEDAPDGSTLPVYSECGEWPYSNANFENYRGTARNVSTVLDLARFAWEFSPNASPSILSRDSIDEMRRDSGSRVGRGSATTSGLGLGFNVNWQFVGDLYKAGGWGGLQAGMQILPTGGLVSSGPRGRVSASAAGGVICVIANGNLGGTTTSPQWTPVFRTLSGGIMWGGGAWALGFPGIIGLDDWGTEDLWPLFGGPGTGPTFPSGGRP